MKTTVRHHYILTGIVTIKKKENKEKTVSMGHCQGGGAAGTFIRGGREQEGAGGG